jgi:hypothetical protein
MHGGKEKERVGTQGGYIRGHRESHLDSRINIDDVTGYSRCKHRVNVHDLVG